MRGPQSRLDKIDITVALGLAFLDGGPRNSLVKRAGVLHEQ